MDDRSDEEIIEEQAGRACPDGEKLLAFLERYEAIDVDLDAEMAAICLRERARYETMGRVLGEFESPERLDPEELVPILEEAGAFDGFEGGARLAAVFRGIRDRRDDGGVTVHESMVTGVQIESSREVTSRMLRSIRPTRARVGLQT